MFERFTDAARQVVVLAQEEARRLGHGYIGTEHLLLGVVREEDAPGGEVLRELGLTADGVRAQVIERVGTGEGSLPGKMPFTPLAKKALELALREALELRHDYIGSEHVLLGLVDVGDGVAAELLEGAAVRDAVMAKLAAVSAAPPVSGVRRFRRGATRLRLDYDVRVLGGGSETWAEQLKRWWQQDDWELVSVVHEDGEYRAIIKRSRPG